MMLENDHKTAALILYALQTASMNLKQTSLEPALPTQVVIDRESVANRRLALRRGPGSRDASTTTLAVTIRTKRAIASSQRTRSACSKGLASAKGRQRARQSGRTQEE